MDENTHMNSWECVRFGKCVGKNAQKNIPYRLVLQFRDYVQQQQWQNNQNFATLARIYPCEHEPMSRIKTEKFEGRQI